jgi:hypothetical protein
MMTNENCAKCGKPIYQDEHYVVFRSGTSPVHAFEPKLRARWCPTPHCFESVETLPNKSGKVPG